MPHVYFRDNYRYEISGDNFSVWKYDILTDIYVKIEECFLRGLPKKYSRILQDIEEAISPHTILKQPLDIKVQ